MNSVSVIQESKRVGLLRDDADGIVILLGGCALLLQKNRDSQNDKIIFVIFCVFQG